MDNSYFNDYDAFTENEISDVTENGIALRNGTFIDFEVCTETWAKTKGVERSMCVGERDAEDLSFTFYSLPKAIMIKFIPVGVFFRHAAKRKAYSRFYALQQEINLRGYTTYDDT